MRIPALFALLFAVCAIPVRGAGPYAATGARQKVQVEDPAVRDALLAGGARLIADYGSFQWLETSPKALSDFGREKVQPQSDHRFIHLHAGVIDTSASAYRTQRVGAFRGKRLHLIQFAAPVTPQAFAALEQTGVRVVDYVPNNAYIVYGEAKALGALQRFAAAEPLVQFEGSLFDFDKVHPRARAPAPAGTAEDAGRLYQIQLVTDPAANAATRQVLAALQRGPVRREMQNEDYVNLVVELDPSSVDVVAAQPDVLSVWPYVVPRKRDERQGMIVAGQLSGGLPTGPGYLAWLASRGFSQAQFDASGLVVDVTDSGLDNGTTNVNHFALFRGGATSGVSRVRYVRREGTANTGSTLQGCDGHGNINAHIIGGHVTLTNFPHTDSAGYRYGLGIAPFVNVGSSVIFDPNNFTFPDYEDLASRAYRDGARVSGNSWGADTFGEYDADAQAYDRLVRDAQPTGSAVPVAGNQQMTFVFAAGNAGPGTGSVGSPATAKNVITVGAAENAHSHATANGGNNTAGNDGCETPDAEANSANDMASFSSRGPCADQRRKPEIVAPGTHVTGGVGQSVKTMAGLGTALSCFDGSGVCALPGGGTAGSTNNFFPLGQRWYSTSSGTSHSTPAVAGGAALAHQWYLNLHAVAPSPAMVKALLMNSARYMTGTSANDTLLSNHQGIGMMNLGMAFDGTPRLLRDQRSNDVFTATGQTRTFTAVVVSNSLPVRVTLVWTDAPGGTTGNAYKNNLDLTVTVNGVPYRGNVFSGASSITGGSADVRNNTESVFLPAGTSGILSIKVTAANINSDGIPNSGGALDQDFALVAYNLQEVLVPAVAVADALLVTESCGLGNGAVDPDEAVTVRVALQNLGTAPTTNLVATLQGGSGVTAPGAAQAYGALAAGGAAVTRDFTFTATGACGGVVSAALALTDGAANLGTVSVNFALGGSELLNRSLTNSAAISIRDVNTAVPYPSTLSVAGLPGAIENLSVTLAGFTHTYPGDVQVLLVGPSGQTVTLLGSVGGSADVNNALLTFSDDATGPVGSTLVSGTYQPSGTITEMPAPAPAAPYGAALAPFIGTDPNGTWSLYVTDDASGDSGAIASGWRLSLTVRDPLCCGSNKPPRLAPIGNRTVLVSNELSFAVTATDLNDGDPITLTVSNRPATATFAAVGGNGSFQWLSAAPTGTYTLVFRAEDKDGFDEETVSIAVMPVPVFNTNCTLILSEYVEGTSNNKAIELYNPGGSAIDLGAGSYLLHLYFNGVTTPANTVNLTGTIPAGGTYVVANNLASSAFLALAQQTSDKLTFNGNDPVVLRSGGAGGAVVDSIGQVGSSADFAKDTTLRRKPAVLAGDQTVNDAFTAGTEWTSFPVDTSDGLGSHTNECGSGGGGGPGTPPVLSPLGDFSTLVGNTLQFQVVATPTDGDPVTLSATGLPGTASFAATNETGVFTWSNAAPEGVYTSRFFAVDKDGTNTEVAVITVTTSGGAGMETFSNLNAPEGGYGGGSYVGDNGITWFYEGARSPDATYAVDGQPIGFGDSARPARTVRSQEIPGGIGDLSLKFRKYFTGAGTRSFDVLINDVLVGSVSNANNTTPDTLVLEDINIEGDVVIKIEGTGAKQFVVDTLSWTAYSSNPPLDSDGDGLPDAWELDHFGSLTNANQFTDYDLDDFSDLEEYVAGTQPTNNASFFRFADFAGQVLSVNGVSGRVYRFEFTTNLIEGLDWFPLQTITNDSDGPLQVPDPATDPQRTYRVYVGKP